MISLRIEKFSNASIPNAVPFEAIGGPTEKELQRFLKKHGGLWVGGKIIVDTCGLTFTLNGINVALHEYLVPIQIPLSSILGVRWRFGWITGIVDIEHENGLFQFRCFGAKRVAETIESYVTKP